MDGATGRSNNDPNSGAARCQKLIGSIAKIPKVAMISVAGPAILLIVGYLLWVNYGAKHLNTQLYGLHRENIILTPQPSWIQSSVLNEVFDEGELGRFSLLDRQMSAAAYNAFRTHPWIRQVFRVIKLAGSQVRIDVEYREPIAMVYVEFAKRTDETTTPKASVRTKTISTLTSAPNESGDRVMSFLPVDGDSVLLPTQDFNPELVTRFMLIYAQAASPIGMVGDEFGDVRIKEALLLCRLLKDDRERLGIERVYVYPDPASQGPSRWTLELTTKNKKIQWGHPPGLESPGEPGIPAKLRKLEEFLLRPKPNESGLNEIDLVVTAKPSLGKAFGPLP